MKFALGVPRWIELAVMFAACYLCADVLVWIACTVARDVIYLDVALRRVLLVAHLGVLCCAATAWTIRKAPRYHPISNPGYRKWLRTTPWRPGMPLPLGPAMLVWFDGIVLLTLVVLAHWHLHVTIALPILCMCCGFAIGSLPALARTFGWGAYVIAIGLAFELRLLGIATLFKSLPMLYLGTGAAMILAAWTQFAIGQSLRRFPWQKDPSKQAAPTPGWLSMIPPDCSPLVSLRVAVASSILLGVWTWAVLSFYEGMLTRDQAIMVVAGAALLGALIRFTKYYGFYRAPISLWGRLLTGRLVLPRYDYGMLAPIAAIIVGPALTLGLQGVLPEALDVAIGVAISLAILLIAPPTFRNWQLTGFHRRIPFANEARPRQARLVTR